MKDKLENLLNQSLDQVMSDRFGRYSKYIIQERALPDVRDGLKPVQRRILYSMHDLGLFHNRAFKKSARVVGDVIGKYHPHGDSSIYEALVRLSQPWKINMPIIEMHGNNGSIDDDPAAAMRYTEARLEKITSLMLKDINKDTVLFAPNFDDSEKEPTVLPGIMPNLLVNGAKGIAAGYATEMPPHNLGEVLDAIVAKIKSPNARLETLMNFIKGPDFPTGGKVQGSGGIYQAFERGRGKIIIRSKYNITDLKTKPSITITEIPYGVIKSKLVKDIDEIRYNNKIDGIKDVRDESDRNGLSIYIELAPNTNINAVIDYLLAKTDMQIYYNYNNVAIKDKVPTVMNLHHLLDAYIKHQTNVQTNALNFDLAKNKKRLEIVDGFIKVAAIADAVIKTIRNAKGSKKGVVDKLIAQYQFTQLQAESIADLRLYRLSQTDQGFYLEEKQKLEKEVKRISQILSSPEELNNYLIKELRAIKKEYAVPRKTIISGEIEAINIDMDNLIKEENVWIGISRQGYIKRFSNRAYEANQVQDYVLKEEDAMTYLNKLSTKNKIIIFTSHGNYFSLPVHKVTENKFKEVGKHLNDFGMLGLEEEIIGAVGVKDFETNAYVLQLSKQGKVKKTLIKDFETTRFNKLYKGFNLKNQDQVVDFTISNGHQQLVVIASDGKAVKYTEQNIPTQGVKSAGVKGMNVESNFATTIVATDNTNILGLISNRGGIKRIKVSEITPMTKSTMGKIIYRSIKGNPHVPIAAANVSPKTEAYINAKTGLSAFTFASVDITKPEEGFSLTAKNKVAGALIQNHMLIDKEDLFFAKVEAKNEEQKFAEAENAIKEIKQIDLDDILKDIK